MLEKLTNYISRKQTEWKSDFFKEPEQKRRYLLFLFFSLVAIYWGAYDYPTDPTAGDTALMLIGVCGGVAGFLTSVAEMLPKSPSQLAGVLRIWAFLAILCTVPAMALQLILAA